MSVSTASSGRAALTPSSAAPNRLSFAATPVPSAVPPANPSRAMSFRPSVFPRALSTAVSTIAATTYVSIVVACIRVDPVIDCGPVVRLILVMPGSVMTRRLRSNGSNRSSGLL